MASATLVVQQPPAVAVETGNESGTTFERVIDRVDALRRLEQVIVRRTDSFVEFRCAVEYGPERASAATLERHVRRQLRLIAERLMTDDYAVFDLACAELTRQSADERIDDLRARANDMAVPLGDRKRMAKAATRLQTKTKAVSDRVLAAAT